MKSFLGIDPGLHGGLALIDEHGKIIETAITPIKDKWLNLDILCALIKRWRDDYQIASAALERVWSFPGQGVSSMFSFGRTYGATQSILHTLNIPYILVTPQCWSKQMHLGIDHKLNPKDRSLIAVKKLYPDANLLATPRCRKPHDGIIDSLLLATYELHQYGKRGK